MLSWAACQGDTKTVQNLLICGANPNTKDRCGETSLHHAARLGKERTVKLLLSAKADPLLMDTGGYTPVDVALTKSIQEYLIAAGSRWGPRVSDFAGSVLARENLFVYHAYLVGNKSMNDPKYNMRGLLDMGWCHVSGIDNTPQAVGVLSFYVATTLSSYADVPLLESQLRRIPFGDYTGPRSGHWSIYRTEQQVSSDRCYVILQGKWNPAKPCLINIRSNKTASDRTSMDFGLCYIGPLGKDFERWYNEFKQGEAYVGEKIQKWREYCGDDHSGYSGLPTEPNSQIDDSWGLGSYYQCRSERTSWSHACGYSGQTRHYKPPPQADNLARCDDVENWGSDCWNSKEEETHDGDSEGTTSSVSSLEELSKLSLERSSGDSTEVLREAPRATQTLGCWESLRKMAPPRFIKCNSQGYERLPSEKFNAETGHQYSAVRERGD